MSRPFSRIMGLTLIVLSGCAATDREVLLCGPTTDRKTVVAERPMETNDSEIVSASYKTRSPVVTTTLLTDALSDAAAATAADEDDNIRLQIDDQDESARNENAQPQSLPGANSSFERSFVASKNAVRLTEVIASVHQSFPLLEVAYLEANIANGTQLAAWGAFDTKVKAASENGSLGFYETYRQSAGFEQPIYDGGSAFGGYRIGRGDFQPWYQERQTNDGGEFKAGVQVPLMRNRAIDARRAELWRATYEQQRVQPEIRAQLIQFVRDASVAYWEWVAAGRRYDIGQRALELSVDRNAKLKRKEELGDLDPPVLQDNLRSIAQRESKLIDRRRKLQQSAIKLSLFLRSPDGAPVIPGEQELADFVGLTPIDAMQLDSDLQSAQSQRPELAALDATFRRVNVDFAEARNDCAPVLDAQLVGSQDVGFPTSRKRDKSEFELEAGLFFEVPIQRRKAQGKSLAAQSKLRQITVKRRFVSDKITTEVRSAFAAVTAGFERVGRAREAKRLAIYMAEVERTKFDLGESDLLSVFLRERNAIEAADDEVDALLEYFTARADYAAALAIDWPRVDGPDFPAPAADPQQ